MDKKYITFEANQQSLQRGSELLRVAGGTVNYIKARFILGDNWQNFDKVTSAWSTGYRTSYEDLDSEGLCTVPSDILTDKGAVRVNLIGTKDNKEVLTTYTTEALIIDETVVTDAEASEPLMREV